MLFLQSQAEVRHKNAASAFLKANPINMPLQAIACFAYILNRSP